MFEVLMRSAATLEVLAKIEPLGGSAQPGARSGLKSDSAEPQPSVVVRMAAPREGLVSTVIPDPVLEANAHYHFWVLGLGLAVVEAKPK